MKEPSKEWKIILYLWWTIQFIICLIIAAAVCLIATAVIGQTTVLELIGCMLHLINV
jgi:TM2 domain-containing membrane protein YozV